MKLQVPSMCLKLARLTLFEFRVHPGHLMFLQQVACSIQRLIATLLSYLVERAIVFRRVELSVSRRRLFDAHVIRPPRVLI